jgi:DNA topoisomerase-1
VKKLEELGIGRPSTYAPTISTILQRGYVVKEDKTGVEREYAVYTLYNGNLKEEIKTEITGAEKAKLFPSDIGMIVNDFLIDHFNDILDYNFTASVEKEFDEIAEGKLNWTKMIDKFYRPFHDKVDLTLKTSDRTVGERRLGIDPDSGKVVIAKVGKFGPLVQIGEVSDEDKPRFAGLMKNQRIETITLEEALELFKLPRKIGQYEEKDITASVGRFGPYLLHSSKFYSLKPATDNPLTVTLERAIELIEAKREADRNKLIKTFDREPDLQILNGRWGPYISYKKENYTISKKQDPAMLTLDDCWKIISENEGKSGKQGKPGKSGKPGKPEKPGKLEKPGKPEKPEKPGKQGKKIEPSKKAKK